MLKKPRVPTQAPVLVEAARRISAPAFAHSWQKRKARAKLRRRSAQLKIHEHGVPLVREKAAA